MPKLIWYNWVLIGSFAWICMTGELQALGKDSLQILAETGLGFKSAYFTPANGSSHHFYLPGFIKTDEFSKGELTFADVSISGNSIICPGSSQPLTAESSSTVVSYLWSTGATTPTIQASSAGVYRVTVTDSNGRTAEGQKEMQLSDLTLSANVTNSTCRQANGSAQLTANGGSGNFSFNWENGFSGTLLEDIPAGTYQVTVSDGICSVVRDITVGFEEEPVIEWSRHFGGGRADRGKGIAITSDGGYIMVGESSSIDGHVSGNIGGFDYWVIKLDGDGNLQWEKSYGSTGSDRAADVQQTQDGGFIVVGNSDMANGDVSGNNGEPDYWILKLNATGNIEWERNYGGSRADEAVVVRQTADRGYIVGGFTSSFDGDVSNQHGNLDAWFIKLDVNGILEWEQSVGGSFNDGGGDIKVVQTADGGFLCSAISASNDGDVGTNFGSTDFWVIKFDAYGKIIWESNFGGAGIDAASALGVLDNGDAIVAGTSDFANGQVSGNNGAGDIWIIRIDPTGNVILWDRNYGGSGDDRIFDLQILDDGTILLAGLSTSNDGNVSFNYGSRDFWILKIHADDGRIIWEQTLGGSGFDQIHSALQTLDGGFIASGYSDSEDGDVGGHFGLRDYWAVKLNAPPLPVPDLGDALEICPQQEVILNAGLRDCESCTYRWADGFSDSLRTEYPAVSTSYSVTVTDKYGCTGADSVLVNVIPPPDIELGNDTILCAGQQLNLDAGAGHSNYLWSNGESTASITIDQAGEYSVEVTNGPGCLSRDTIQIEVNSLPLVDLGVDQSVCQLQALQLNGRDPSCTSCQYQWSDDPDQEDAIREILVSNDATISLTVTDGNGCMTSDEVQIFVIPSPNIDIEVSLIAEDDNCESSSFNIFIPNAEADISYLLLKDGSPVGEAKIGDGEAITFNTGPLNNSTEFAVLASNALNCTDTLTNSKFEISIGDNIPPSISCPDDLSILLGNGECDLMIKQISPVYSDNCAIAAVTYQLSGATETASPPNGIHDASGEIFGLGVTTVTYTAVDAAGLQSSCSFQVELRDVTAPLIVTQASNLTVECDGNGNQVEFQNWLTSFGGARADETCSTISWRTDPAAPQISDDCGGTGAITVRFIVEDEAGNTASTLGVFTVQDTQAPTFTGPNNVKLNFNENPLDLSLTGDVIDEYDKCDPGIGEGDIREATYTDLISSSPCADTIYRSWILIDVCDNKTEQIQIILLEREPVIATISGGGTICPGEETDLSFNFTHPGLFDVVYSDGANEFVLEGIADGHVETVTPGSSGTYRLISVEDRLRPSCPGTVSGQAEIVVRSLAQIENNSLQLICNELNNSYTVGFSFTATFPSGLVITDENGQNAGILTGTQFISNPIPSGQPYTILIEDGGSCGLITLSDAYECPCITNAGSFLDDSYAVCGTEFPLLNYGNNAILDDNDLLEFVLHEGDQYNIGRVIARNNVAEFTFGENMKFRTTYYITAIAGNSNGQGEVDPDDACRSISFGVPVIFYEIPTAIIDTANLLLSCATNTLQLDGTVSGGVSDLAFQWSTPDGDFLSGDTTGSPVVSKAGTYHLTVTDRLSGCSSSAEVMVKEDEELPVVKLLPPQEITCSNPEVSLDGSASSSGPDYNFQWKSEGGHGIVSGVDQPLAVVDQAGLYTLVVTDQSKNCKSSATIEVVQNVRKPIAEAGEPFLFDCNDHEGQLNGSGSSTGTSYKYHWTTQNGTILSGNQSLQPRIGSSGKYQLVVTDIRNGCSATDEVVVPVNETFPTGASLNYSSPKCVGESNGQIVFQSVEGGTAPFVYSIDGETYYSESGFFDLSPGRYFPTVQDANGCIWQSELQLEVPEPIHLDIGSDTRIALGDSIRLNAQVNIPADDIKDLIWSEGEQELCNKCSTVWVRPLITTGYHVVVENAQGCIKRDSIKITVQFKDRVYVPNVFSPNNDGNNDVFYIHTGAEVEKIAVFQVYDRWGEAVFQAQNFFPNDPAFGWDGKYRDGSVVPGVYVYYAEIHYISGKREIIKGDITILR